VIDFIVVFAENIFAEAVALVQSDNIKAVIYFKDTFKIARKL